MSASFRLGGILIEDSITVDPSNLPSASDSGAGIVQLEDSVSSTSTTTAATANSVKTAYDAAAAASVWVENAGALSPATPNTIVSIPVPQGIDGLIVLDEILSVSTLVAPGYLTLLDNIQSISVDPTNSRVIHVIDSLMGTIPGVLSVDENGDPAPYNLQVGELQINGTSGATGTFTSQDGKTITVTNGLITSIV